MFKKYIICSHPPLIVTLPLPQFSPFKVFCKHTISSPFFKLISSLTQGLYKRQQFFASKCYSNVLFGDIGKEQCLSFQRCESILLLALLSILHLLILPLFSMLLLLIMLLLSMLLQLIMLLLSRLYLPTITSL